MKKGPGTIFLAAVLGMVLLATAAVVLAEERRNTTFPADSPQGVVKEYLVAISNDEKMRAFSFVAEESSCEQADMDAAFGAAITRTIVQFAHIQKTRAEVGIRLELAIPSVYGGKTSRDLTFFLVRENGEWKLTQQIWPMESCPKVSA